MEPVLAAGVVVRDDAGRVLLVLRARDPERGRWSIPGGRVEPGERLRDAAAREAFEETGLRIAVGAELWQLTIPAGGGRVYEVHDFAATVIGGELAPGDDAADARWVDADELASMPLTAGLAGYLARAGIVPADG